MCILFVDDEAMLTMVFGEALQDAGHRVMTAGHAPAAVRLIEEHPGLFTCLVTDFHMPGELTGADLIEHARGRYPAIPIVLATGRPDVVQPHWIKRHHVDLLVKPFSPDLLVGTVARLLNGLAANGHRKS